jgi:hypothetical protein
VANASVFEVCSGSQPASAAASIIVGVGSVDTSMTGGTGQYRLPQVGDLVVVFIGSDNTSGSPTGVQDSKGNTWTSIQTQTGAVNQQFKVMATIVAAGKAMTGTDTITGLFASSSGSHHLIAKAIIGPSSVSAFNQATAQGSGGGTWSSGPSGAVSGTKVLAGVLQNANAGGAPTALTFDAANATYTHAPSGHWSVFMVDTDPPAAGEAAGGTTASGTWAAGIFGWDAPAPVTGTGAVKAKKIALAGTAGYIAPTTGTGAVQAKKAALAGAATYTDPVTGTGTVAAKKAALAATATYTAPATGTGAIVAKKITLAGAGTYTPPPVTGTGAVHAKKIALSGAATYTAPVTGTGAVHAKKIALAGLGSYGVTPVTGTGTVTAKKIALAGTGALTAAVTGTATFTAKKIALAGSGTYGGILGPVTGTGTITAKKIRLAGAGEATAPPLTPPPVLFGAAAPTLVPIVWDRLSLNDGDRDDGLTTVVTSVDGWYGSPPVDGHDLTRALTDGAVRGTKIVAPRTVAITGAAAGPRALTLWFARALSAQAVSSQPASLTILEDDGTDQPRSLTASVRADTDPMQMAWTGRTYFTYQLVLTAIDPRLYSTELQAHTLFPLASGVVTGRIYPWTPPRQYPGATLSNAIRMINAGSRPAPVQLSYFGDLSESRLTDGVSTLHLAAIGAGQQINVNSETLVAATPSGASRQSYVMAGTTPLVVLPFSDTVWSLYGTGAGYLTLAYRESWA